jgi:hypothetical protein
MFSVRVEGSQLVDAPKLQVSSPENDWTISIAQKLYSQITVLLEIRSGESSSSGFAFLTLSLFHISCILSACSPAASSMLFLVSATYPSRSETVLACLSSSCLTLSLRFVAFLAFFSE